MIFEIERSDETFRESLLQITTERRPSDAILILNSMDFCFPENPVIVDAHIFSVFIAAANSSEHSFGFGGLLNPSDSKLESWYAQQFNGLENCGLSGL